MRARLWITALGVLGCGGEPPLPRDELARATSALEYREESELLSPSSGFGAYGSFLAVDGHTAFVADQWSGDDPFPEAGTVYVFDRTGSTWTVGQTLLPSVRRAHGEFGFAVALSGDTGLIGSVGEPKGAVFVWQRVGGSWSEGQKLVPADGTPSGAFGAAIALGGDIAIIGAPGDGVSGDGRGAAYVYALESGAWTETAKLVPSDAVAGLQFGSDVAFENDTIVVGAPAEGATESLEGRAYVYQRSGASWVEQRLAIDDGFPDDSAGRAVSINSDVIVVGAPADAHSLADRPGAAYVFRRQGSAFVRTSSVAASDASPGDMFGFAMSAKDGRLVVGAPGADTASKDAGAVYAFDPSDTGFDNQSVLVAAELVGDSGLGASVATSGSTLLVGTYDISDDVVFAFALLGAPCDGDAACETGSCVDGVCCESSCDGACETCAAPGNAGHCVASPPASPDAACDAYVCGENGSCKTTCVSTADCAEGHACNEKSVCVAIASGASTSPKNDSNGCVIGKNDRGDGFSWLAVAIVVASRIGARRAQSAKKGAARRARNQCEKFT